MAIDSTVGPPVPPVETDSVGNRLFSVDNFQVSARKIPSAKSTDMANEAIRRREFLESSAAAVAALGIANVTEAVTVSVPQKAFAGPDSLVHSHEWESLNPGYWQMKDGALRRQLRNVGDRARSTGFPFHSATKGGVMQTEHDPRRL